MKARDRRLHFALVACFGGLIIALVSGRGSVPTVKPGLEIAIVGSPESSRTQFLVRVAREYSPVGTHIAVGLGGSADPLLKGRTSLNGEPTAYVCSRGLCRFPTTDPDRLVREIQRALE